MSECRACSDSSRPIVGLYYLKAGLGLNKCDGYLQYICERCTIVHSMAFDKVSGNFKLLKVKETNGRS
jgi:hypothetical protein